MQDKSQFNKSEEKIHDEIKFLQVRITELEKAEARYKVADELLHKSEFQQKAILNNIPDIAWLKDKDSRFIAVNEPFARSCGFSQNELIGKTDLDIWPKELALSYRMDDQDVMRSKKRKCVEERLADKEGKIQWIETIKTPIFNDSGEVIGTTGIARDITVRKNMEEALRANEERLIFSLDSGGFGVWDIDLNKGTVWRNLRHDQIFGYDELLPEWTLDIFLRHVLPIDRERVNNVIQQTISNGGSSSLEFRIVRKDGLIRWIWTQGKIYENKESGLKKYLGTVLDITERKDLEEKIREVKSELEIRVKVRTADLARTNEDLVHEINLRKLAEEKIKRLNEGFISLNDNPGQNIKKLVSLCGELLSGDCALYNRLNDGLLYTVAHWNIPADFECVTTPEGHICYDLIKHSKTEPQLITDLLSSDYAETDPNVSRYNLKTYFGCAVEISSKSVGTLCVVYQRDFSPNDDDRKIVSIISSAIGIEEMRGEALKLIKESEHRYRVTIEQTGQLIYDYDIKSGNILWCGGPGPVDNVIGYAKDKFYCPSITNFEEFIHPEDRKRVLKKISDNSRSGTNFDLEFRLRKYDGLYVIVKNRSVFIKDDKGLVMRMLGCMEDITKDKEAETRLESLNAELIRTNRKLKLLTLTDSHTGLFNHRYLGEVIEAEFQRARRFAHPLSIILLDVDYFKSINDVYGHQFGDVVLKQIARQLKMMVRKYDITIRFGGEEFVIISPVIDRTQALALGQRILDAVNAYVFGNKKQAVKVKLSLGVVSYPEDSAGNGLGLINLADKVLSKVKEAGGNRIFTTADLKKDKLTSSKPNGKLENITALQNKIDKLTKRANQGLVEAIYAFAKAIELKDYYTGQHVEDTVHYVMGICQQLSLPKEEVEFIKQGAILHDLGKLGISEKILHKKSKLTKDEFEEIKKHPQIGADILRPIQFMHNIIPLVLYHHERWDGSGYPMGIKGEEIPIGARIISVADVYQALTSNRPYRKAYSKERAIKLIKSGAGSQFDPEIVKIFVNLLREEKYPPR